MLIIEGSDNLGKTTFAKKLVRYVWDHDIYPCMYSWMTRPNEMWFDFFESYKMMINSYTVQDRFHLGALAYHKDKITTEHLSQIETWIDEVGGVIVILYSSNENWYRKWISADTRGNLLAVPKLCKANSIFRDIAHTLQNKFPPSIAFNISQDSFLDDKHVERVADCWIKRRREHIEQLILPLSGR